MICSRNYATYGPYTVTPSGSGPRFELHRVLDGEGRRITRPIPHREAKALCVLLNDVFAAGLNAELKLILPH